MMQAYDAELGLTVAIVDGAVFSCSMFSRRALWIWLVAVILVTSIMVFTMTRNWAGIVSFLLLRVAHLTGSRARSVRSRLLFLLLPFLALCVLEACSRTFFFVESQQIKLRLGPQLLSLRFFDSHQPFGLGVTLLCSGL